MVGVLPLDFNEANTNADTTAGCVDVMAADQVAELEHNDLFAFREGDFSFQTLLELDAPPAETGAVIAEHPGSWTLSLFPGATPGNLLLRLEVRAKDGGIIRPGLPGDLLTLEGPLACASPCSANIAFTILGLSYAKSSARIYIDGVMVDEFHGNQANKNTPPNIKEVYATGTEAVILGNDASGTAAIQGRLVDPRFFSMNLTPDEVAVVMAEQDLNICAESSCHP
jgi:hypothetical protein